LDEVRPRSVHFASLWDQIDLRLASSPTIRAAEGQDAASPDEFSARSPARLAEALLDTYGHNVVELHVREPDFTTEIAECPRASPVARRQAAAGSRIANLRHRIVRLIDFDQLILAHLDGRHDRRALVRVMQGAIQAGTYTFQIQGRAISDPEEAEPILLRVLEESLRRLAAGALLVG
jgi:hypothetical protein